ncbi:MAG: hypothetical protein R3Y36_01805 [Spirochaetales bacterium]
MNLEFVEAVINMRKAQKKYFSNRLPSAFEEAKTHEKNVDKKIQKIQKQESPFQNELFFKEGC